MVQVAENWSRVRGTVQAVKPDRELAGHVVLTVAVEAAEPVEKPDGGAYPNMLARTVGTAVDLTVRADSVAHTGLQEGRRISARAQLSSPARAFVDPGDLRVE